MYLRSLSIDGRSGLDVDSSAFRQRAPRILLSNDPDVATAQTAQAMVGIINEAAGKPIVREYARRAVLQFSPFVDAFGQATGNASPQRSAAEACFWWCKHYLKFRHHGDMFEAWSGDWGDPNNKLQLLIAPDILLRMRKMEGDCAIYVMMCCAMIKSLGIDYQVCPCAADHKQPRIFTHVFSRAVLPHGTESLDASHGPYPGWQVPQEDMLRLWVFNSNGSQIVHDDGNRFRGLHAYRSSRGLSGMRRGLGAQVCDDTGYCYDDGTGTDVNASTTSICDAAPMTPGCPGAPAPVTVTPTQTTIGGVPGYTAPAGGTNSAQWAQFAAALAKSGLTLAEINAIQPGTVVSANGAILRQNPGFSVPSFGTGIQLSSLGSSSSLLTIGMVVVGVLVVSSLFGGKK